MSVRILHSFFPKNVKNKFSDIIGLYYCTDFQISGTLLQVFALLFTRLNQFVPKFKFKNSTKHFNTKKE